MKLKRNKTYHSVIRFAGKRAAIRMLAPDIENSRAKKLLCTHELEISGPHKVFFVDFDRKPRGRAFTCSTAIFFRAWLMPGKKVNCDWVIMVTVSHKRADWLRKR